MAEYRSPRGTRAEWLPHEARGDAQPWRGEIRHATFDAVDAWRGEISGAFVPLAPEPIGPAPFHGAFQQIIRGAISLSRIEGSPQRVRRGAREIAATNGDVAFLNVQLAGTGQVRGGGEVRQTSPGSGAIVLAEQPFELAFEAPFSQLCVTMRTDWLRDRIELPIAIAATRNIDLLAGAGRVVKAALSALMEAADPAEAAQCADLFASALDLALRPRRAADMAPDKALIDAVRRLMGQQLGDETLSPARAAALLGCSVRTLHAACQRDGLSFGRMLLETRLDAAEKALRSAPCLNGRVGRIAFACGFSNLSHFSRAFRARFGTGPGGYRGPA